VRSARGVIRGAHSSSWVYPSGRCSGRSRGGPWSRSSPSRRCSPGGSSSPPRPLASFPSRHLPHRDHGTGARSFGSLPPEIPTMKNRRLLLPALIATFLVPAAGNAQLGGRPAEEWATVLESGRRMEGLEIENVVRAISLQS